MPANKKKFHVSVLDPTCSKPIPSHRSTRQNKHQTKLRTLNRSAVPHAKKGSWKMWIKHLSTKQTSKQSREQAKHTHSINKPSICQKLQIFNRLDFDNLPVSVCSREPPGPQHQTAQLCQSISTIAGMLSMLAVVGPGPC